MIGRTKRAGLLGLLLLAMAGPAPARAGIEGGDAASLRLVVRHALDAGRLVVRIGEAAFYSAPLSSLETSSTGTVERLLSIPAGLQTVGIELRDMRGRIIARREVRGLLTPGGAAVLDVVASATGDRLRCEMRTSP